MNDGFCFGVFGEHKKQKVPFLLRERLPGILKNLMFPPNFPPNFPWKQYLVVGRVIEGAVCWRMLNTETHWETFFKIYKLHFVSVLIIWKMEKNKRSYGKQTTNNPRSFEWLETTESLKKYPAS